MKKSNILICVTGGISAYKIPNLCREFIKKSHNVKIVMTENATKFISPLTFEAIVRSKVHVNEFAEGSEESAIEHINLVDWADIIIIAPATANTIAKIAHGIGDNLLTSLMLVAFEKPTFICPSMNTRMYLNPITQQNIKNLSERGIIIIEPDEGDLACGDIGPGRLREIRDIYNAVDSYIKESQNLKGLKFIITALPTNGLPSISSSAPGPSPININLACRFPSPKTTLVLFSASLHFTHESTVFFNRAIELLFFLQS